MSAQPFASSVVVLQPRPRAWATSAGLAGCLAAAALSLAFAAWVYGLPFMLGQTPFWHDQASDITQYLAGFNAFIREPWHWPLLRIEGLNAPQGTLATFLDTVPLYAMLLKLIAHGPGTEFWNPYALWIGICFTLQGVGAWWICREGQIKGWVSLLCLALLLASFPALTVRIHHTSLMSQWMLLFALAIYLRSSRLGRLALLPWVILVPCAFYINIYIFAMLSAVFAADCLRYLRQDTKRVLLAPVAAYGILTLTMVATMLPLAPNAGGPEWGFGFYSMNLLAPFHGGSLLHIAKPQATDGQGEGFNYLGLFLIAAIALAIVLRLRRDPGFLRRHAILAGILFLLTLFAISTEVYFGEQRVLKYSLPPALDTITGTFRSSGRFFWPVGYALCVFAVLSLQRYLPARVAAPLLVLLVALQLWDLREHHQRTRDSVAIPAREVIDEAGWKSFLGTQMDTMQYYPPFRCGKSAPQQSLLPVTLFAVKQGYRLSTGYVARANKRCDNFAEEIAGMTSPRTAFVFEHADFPQQSDVEQLLGGPDKAECRSINAVYLCKRRNQSTEENKQ